MQVKREQEALQQFIRAAGRRILQIAREGFDTEHKANQDPVTTADLAADRILKDGLLGGFPGTGWLSEETRDNPDRLECPRVWIVDPVDGTKEFVTGIPEFSVSVALIEEGAPVLAAVYNPSTDELFLAAKGKGAALNGVPMQSDRPLPDRPRVLASRSEIKRGEWAAFEPLTEVVPCGSIAYKLALVAAGRADATFSLEPKNEWDIAAGVLLVDEAGGHASDKHDRPFLFNRKDTLVDSIVAATANAREKVYDLIARATGAKDPGKSRP